MKLSMMRAATISSADMRTSPQRASNSASAVNALELQVRERHARFHLRTQALLGARHVAQHRGEFAAPGRMGPGDVGGITRKAGSGIQQQAVAFARRQAFPVAMLVMQRGGVAVHRHDGRVGQFGIGLATGGEKHQAHLELAETGLERGLHRPVSGQRLHCCLLDAVHFPRASCRRARNPDASAVGGGWCVRRYPARATGRDRRAGRVLWLPVADGGAVRRAVGTRGHRACAATVPAVSVPPGASSPVVRAPATAASCPAGRAAPSPDARAAAPTAGTAARRGRGSAGRRDIRAAPGLHRSAPRRSRRPPAHGHNAGRGF